MKEELGPLIKASDYTDEKGNLIYQSCRHEPKEFRARRPDGKGGWINNIEGVKRVLYRLPEVIAAPEVIIVEGEKDCDSLAELGFTATTNPFGAETWEKEADSYNPPLKDKDIILIKDNDAPGKRHMEQVGRSLDGTAKSMKWIDLPVEEDKDVSDWVGMPFRKNGNIKWQSQVILPLIME